MIDPIDTLTMAFQDDPGFAWVCSDATRRPRVLRHVFAASLAHSRRVGGVITAADAAAVALWSTDSTMSIGFVDAVRAGAVMLPFRIGLPTMRRLNELERHGLGAVGQAVDAPFAYLQSVAVHPGAQGQGHGAATIAEVRAQAEARGYRTLVLKTETEDNVALYEHLGFERRSTTTSTVTGLTTHVLSRAISPDDERG